MDNSKLQDFVTITVLHTASPLATSATASGITFRTGSRRARTPSC